MKTKIPWEAIISSNFRMGFRDLELTYSSLCLHLSEIYFSEIPDVASGSGTGDSQDKNHLNSVSHGRAYTLRNIGDSAWERLGTITRGGGGTKCLGAPGHQVRSACFRVGRNAGYRKCPFHCMWFLLSLLPCSHFEGPSRRKAVIW